MDIVLCFLNIFGLLMKYVGMIDIIKNFFEDWNKIIELKLMWVVFYFVGFFLNFRVFYLLIEKKNKIDVCYLYLWEECYIEYFKVKLSYFILFSKNNFLFKFFFFDEILIKFK